MEVEKVFVSNYLSREKNSYGILVGIGIIALCFVMSIFYWDTDLEISSWLAASPQKVFVEKEYWRPFTSVFIHSGMEHLLSNSLMLFILTYFVTSFYGFWISPVLSSIMGGVINFLVLATFEKNITLMGASGVVYYLWGFWLVLFLLIERQTSLIRRLIKVGGLFLILLVPTTYAPSTSYMAHYLGFIIGVICGFICYPFFSEKIHKEEKWKLVPIPEFEEKEV